MFTHMRTTSSMYSVNDDFKGWRRKKERRMQMDMMGPSPFTHSDIFIGPVGFFFFCLLFLISVITLHNTATHIVQSYLPATWQISRTEQLFRHDEHHIIQVCLNVSLDGLAGDCHHPSPTLTTVSNHKQKWLLDWNTSRNYPIQTEEQIVACSFSCCCFCHGPWGEGFACHLLGKQAHTTRQHTREQT